MTAMTDLPGLPDFLLARWTEDEAGARAAKPAPWRWDTTEGSFAGEPTPPDAPSWGTGGPYLLDAQDEHVVSSFGHDADNLILDRVDAEHIARWDPDRVLAGVQRGRLLVQLYQEWERTAHVDHDPYARGAAAVLQKALQLEALPYAGHDDCQPDWLPKL